LPYNYKMLGGFLPVRSLLRPFCWGRRD